MNKKVQLKTPAQLKIMAEGGKHLSAIKAKLEEKIVAGVSAAEIEDLATSLIKKAGGKPSFKMVSGYSWSTCVNVNDGIVHGIPKASIVFKSGDVVSIDLGIYYKGFHTDTSLTKAINPSNKTKEFLQAGEKALKKAIEKAQVGNKIADISGAIQETIESAGLTPIRALVGHGVGRELHEYPPVPCFVSDSKEQKIQIKQGLVIAIEVMYTSGPSGIFVDKDGWTIRTKSGKIAALFEETVAVTQKGPIVFTE